MAFEGKLLTHTVGTGSYVLDGRFFPLLITGWFGDLTHELVVHFFEARSEFTSHAKQAGLKVIQITESSRMGVPTAAVRKSIADHTLQADANSGVMIEYVVVIPSSIMRGVVTAVNWISGDKGTPMVNVGSLDAAFSRVEKVFSNAGIKFTAPADYKMPEP